MKSLIITAALALAATTVSAGLGIGSCPTVSSVPYSADMQTNRLHDLVAIDKSANSLMNMARKVVSAIPDISCLALGEFPYPDSDTYDGIYNTNTGALSMTMLYFDVATLTEVAYMCFDYAKISSIVSALTLPVPSWLVNIGLQVLRVGHFDLTLVLSNQHTFTTAEAAVLTTGIQAQIPKFAWEKLSMIDRTACV